MRWGGGLTLLAVAVAAGTLSLTLNVASGLETGLAAVIAFGLADVGKIVIPIVAGGLGGWTRQMKVTAAVCVAVSLWCAVNYYADHAGQALLAREHGQTVYADKARAIAELEAEAARLDALATDEAGQGGCGKNCRALNDQASAARQRLKEARTARADARPVEISGLASLIAMASGTSADEIARGIGAVKAGLFLILLECLVWLSLPAMALLRMPAARRREIATETEPVAVTIANGVNAVNGDVNHVIYGVKPRKTNTSDYYLQRLERDHPAIANRVKSRELSLYRGCVEAGLRKAPAKSKWTTVAAYLPADA